MVTAIVLNWNTTNIVVRSVERLSREPDVEVIVIDNGSDDVVWLNSKCAWERLRTYGAVSSHVTVVPLSRNYGSSRARNVGVQLARGSEIFLLDGDILYVPGTISAYLNIMKQTGAACVGQNHPSHVEAWGYNGTAFETDAALACPSITEGYIGVPMAWTQYGLFNADMLRKHPFPTHGAFGEPGHGYEDDWLYRELAGEAGGLVIAVREPTYYHEAHSSMRELKKKNMETRTDERQKLFIERWGYGPHWTHNPRTETIRLLPLSDRPQSPPTQEQAPGV